MQLTLFGFVSYSRPRFDRLFDGRKEKRREKEREKTEHSARQNVTIRLRPRSDTNCALLIVADGGRLGRAEALADSALPHPSSASPSLSLSLPHGPPRVPVLFLPSPAPRVVRTTPTQRNARPPALLRLSPLANLPPVGPRSRAKVPAQR